MNRNYHWERIPVKIVSLKKQKELFGILRIEAVLESRTSEVVKRFHINWSYSPSVKTSDKLYGNLVPKCFFWAYNNAEEGQEVVLHHCLDDNAKYFYYC